MRLFWIAPLAIVGIAVFAFIGGMVVRLLWNWLLPPMFGWPTVTFWQALGLLALCRILFGGLAAHGRGPRWGSWRGMRGRWDHMTPEERERIKQAWFGTGPAAEEGKSL
jgi:hypothetical protein